MKMVVGYKYINVYIYMYIYISNVMKYNLFY